MNQGSFVTALAVTVCGYFKEDQHTYIAESLQRESAKVEELRNYLDNQPTISGLCYLPFNMVILL